MTGVEILAAEEVVVEYAFSWKYALISGGLMVLFFVVLDVILNAYERGSLSGITVVGLVLGLFIGGIVGASESTPISYETQYKVIISSEVKMSDFLEKYEIIDSEGKIYTVREKNK